MTDEKKSSLSAEKEFKVLIERKILIQENCYLLIDLVEQMAKLYEIYSVKEFNKTSKTVCCLHQVMEFQ